MEERRVDTIQLDNGLTLELFDRSKRVAGDRWLVVFVARVKVPVKRKYLEGEEGLDLPLEGVRRALGDRATYVGEKKSHFVDEKDKDKVFNKLKDEFLETNLGYLSSPDFPQRLLMREWHVSQGAAIRWKPQ